ncbi:hypothetical protein CC78DRAFT_584223 [Lojkania enalia]|uniref:protein-ribulosamine 3-kinase n=1 Tax=Lojkania enalia TaxID=147567 RepID=A0A9P4K7P0_9PLEO|nr:hypothetical protein CC78DRAFT_584223 [Didymosphaeria enalia]
MTDETASSTVAIKGPVSTEEPQFDPIVTPRETGLFNIDKSVIDSFPIRGTRVIHAFAYGQSRLSQTVKLVVEFPDKSTECYFLKVIMQGELARKMCEGEYESLKAIHDVSPDFSPKPYAWGNYGDGRSESYFILEEFPPALLARGLADLHQRSKSPTGKFGFHVQTCHGRIVQQVEWWDDSWAAVFDRHLRHFISLAYSYLKWPEFDAVGTLILDKVVPRLLLPLQQNSHILKPSLIHGDCWDGNTAMNAKSGNAFVIDMCSFYGHNEYDTGNWRAPRHKLSSGEYISHYKAIIPPSEPAGDWDARNLLYSLTFNIGNAISIPGSRQAHVVCDDMMALCNMFCPNDLRDAMAELEKSKDRSVDVAWVI